MPRIESLLSRLFLLLLSTAVSFLLLEIGARLYLTKLASEEGFQRYASQRQLLSRYGQQSSVFVPHPYVAFAPRAGLERDGNRHNRLGFRGDEIEVPKPPDEFRIACLGGSTTYTIGVPHDRSYPAQLEKALNNERSPVSVVNAGVPDWTSWETLASLQFRVLDLEPDLVIVYHAVNDVEARMVWPPETFRSDNSGSRGALVEWVRMPSILEYSTFLRILLIRRGAVEPHGGLDMIFRRPPSSIVTRYRRQVSAGTYPSGLFAETPMEEILDRNSPIYFRRNLVNLVAVARAHGVAVVLATMATAPQDAGLRFGSPLDLAAIEEMNEVIRSVAGETEAELYDFASEFPQDARYFADAVHVNSEGAELKAKLFARFLLGAELLRATARF